jgi:hypothetical protein
MFAYPVTYPSVSLNRLWNIVAANDAAERLFSLQLEDGGTPLVGRHILQVFFSSDGSNLLGPDYRASMLRTVSLFDALTRQFNSPHDPLHDQYVSLMAELAREHATFEHLLTLTRSFNVPESLNKLMHGDDHETIRPISACDIYPVLKLKSQETLLDLSCKFQNQRADDSVYRVSLVPADPVTEAALILFYLPSSEHLPLADLIDDELRPLIWSRCALQTVLEALRAPNAAARTSPKTEFDVTLIEILPSVIAARNRAAMLFESVAEIFALCVGQGLDAWTQTGEAAGDIARNRQHAVALTDLLVATLAENGVREAEAISRNASAIARTRRATLRTVAATTRTNVPSDTWEREPIGQGQFNLESRSERNESVARHFANSRAAFDDLAEQSRQSVPMYSPIDVSSSDQFNDIEEAFRRTRDAFRALADESRAERQPPFQKPTA